MMATLETPTSRRTRVQAPALSPNATTIALLFVAICLGASVGISKHDGVQLCAAVIASLGCALLPVRALPPIAIVLTLIIPVQIYTPAISMIPFVAWVVRAPRTRPRPVIRTLALTLGLWSILSFAVAPLHTKLGNYWEITFLGAIVLPLTFSVPDVDMTKIRGFLINFSALLGAYAVVEKWALHSNPLYGSLLAHHSADPLVQKWSTYRATTLIGHPLINGTVFAFALVLAFDDFLTSPSGRRLHAVRLLCLAGGLIATVSRGPTIAAAVGLAMLLALSRRGDRQASLRKAIAVTGIIAIGAVGLPLLVERDESTKGTESLKQRSYLIQDTELTLRHSYVFGVGPGESGAYRTAKDLPRSSTPLESELAEILVELGIPGCLLVLLVMFAVIGVGLRNPATVGAACAMLTLLISLATFESMETRQNLMVLIGLASAFILSPNSGSVIRRRQASGVVRGT
jgi:hypothetical protein